MGWLSADPQAREIQRPFPGLHLKGEGEGKVVRWAGERLHHVKSILLLF